MEERQIGQREQRLVESQDVRQCGQEQQAGDERGREAESAGARLLVRRQFPGDDGDEDNVVDAEDDLHRRQRDEGDNRFEH